MKFSVKNLSASDSGIGLRWLTHAFLLTVWLTLTGVCVSAATPIQEYSSRIELSAKRIQKLVNDESLATEVIKTMAGVKRMMPASEEVSFDNQVVRVDNQWLHEAADRAIKDANGDAEQLRDLLISIKNRLTALQTRVNQAQVSLSTATTDEQARLKNILSRPEYSIQQNQESSIKRWLREFGNWVRRLLRMLFGSGAARTSPIGEGSGAVTAIRVLIIILAAVALGFGLIKLARRIKPRRRVEQEMEAREVLGEEIAPDAKASDLLAAANEMARQGDYRAAIRRAYIALLVELEQRGRLRLHKSKTNRDYLNAVKPDEVIYQPFSTMTGTFEHVWYGQEKGSEVQFNDYLAKYHETTKD